MRHETAIDLRRILWAVVIAAAAWAALLLGAMVLWAGTTLSQLAGHIDARLVAFAVAMFALNHVLRFARWHWMLRIEGHAVPWRRSLAVFLAGLALVPTPGKAGVAVRSLLLQRDGVPVSVSLALYFSERLFDLLGLLVLAALLVQGSTTTRWIVALTVAALGVIAVRIAPRVARALLSRAWPATRIARSLEWLLRFLEHSADLVRGRLLAPSLLAGVGANLATAWVLLEVVEAAGEELAVAHAAAIVAVSHLSGSLSLLPGGLAGFEAAMLASLDAAGITAGTALAALVLVRLVTVWFGVAVGLPLLWQATRAPEITSRPQCP